MSSDRLADNHEMEKVAERKARVRRIKERRAICLASITFWSILSSVVYFTSKPVFNVGICGNYPPSTNHTSQQLPAKITRLFPRMITRKRTRTQDAAFPPQDDVVLCAMCAEPTADRQNRLVTPCRCRGTIGHVHVGCLAEWVVNGSGATRSHCATCSAEYMLSAETITAVARLAQRKHAAEKLALRNGEPADWGHALTALVTALVLGAVAGVFAYILGAPTHEAGPFVKYYARIVLFVLGTALVLTEMQMFLPTTFLLIRSTTASNATVLLSYPVHYYLHPAGATGWYDVAWWLCAMPILNFGGAYVAHAVYRRAYPQ